MKKRNLKSLALTGLAAGLLVSAQGITADKTKQPTTQQKQASGGDDFDKAFAKYDGNITYHLMTEEELLRELTPEGQKMYKSLSPEGKELARKVASTACNGQNECKGLGGCETEEHSCAGKNKCKGKGKCAQPDKNLAVKLVYDKMKEKREKANGGE